MTNFLKDIATGPRIILVTGHFGSGKTEFSVSLAFALAALRDEGAADLPALALCDLDLENPYFRSRELTEAMESRGIRVYSDPYHGRNGSELQTLDPAILAPVQNSDCRVIMDTGGNNTGAMILNQFRKHFGGEYRMLYVVNMNRPGTDTVEKNLAEIKAIESTTGLTVTGLVSNSHFIRETTARDVLEGFEFAEKVGAQSGLPVLCACCSEEIARKLKDEDFANAAAAPSSAAQPENAAAGSDASVLPRHAASAPAVSMEIFPIGLYMRQTYLDKKV